MAALVNVQNCVVLNNPNSFTAPFQFEIAFECMGPLQEGRLNHRDQLFFSLTHFLLIDLEWKLIYVGSAESEQFDQELESIMVGPVQVGLNKFIFEVRINFFSFFFLLF